MVIILGLGFTGQRLARRLLRRRRSDVRRGTKCRAFPQSCGCGTHALGIETGFSPRIAETIAILVNLIPPLQEADNAALRTIICRISSRAESFMSRPPAFMAIRSMSMRKRPVQPSDERGRRRLAEEQWVDFLGIVVEPDSAGRSDLRTRPRRTYSHSPGKMPRAGSGVVSRIHVEDLAALIEAGLFSDLEGAWPVADDAPCSSAEIAAWLLQTPKIGGNRADSSMTRRPHTGRRVDGRRIRENWGVELAYPSWRTGIPEPASRKRIRTACQFTERSWALLKARRPGYAESRERQPARRSRPCLRQSRAGRAGTQLCKSRS